MVHEGERVAAALGIPFVTVSNALILLEEGTIPPFFTMWPYQSSALASDKKRAGLFRFQPKAKGKTNADQPLPTWSRPRPIRAS